MGLNASSPCSPLCAAAREHFREWLDDLLAQSEMDSSSVPCHMFNLEGVYQSSGDCEAISKEFGAFLDQNRFKSDGLEVRCGALRELMPGGSWVQIFLRPLPKD